ncbi:MAG: hypothetical protein AAF206_29795, partial [Bacteroidota bacterium]
KERKRFEGFLRMEATGKLSVLSSLYEAIQKTEDRNQLWQALYPDQVFDDAKMRWLYNQLKSKAEDFLAYLQVMKDGPIRNASLLQEILDRDIEEVFPQIYRKAKNHLNQMPVKGSQHYQGHYELETVNLDFHLKRGDRAKTLETLVEINQTFDLYWIHAKLRMAISNQSLLLKEKKGFDTRFVEGLVEVVRNEPHFLEHPSIAIYLTLIQLNEENQLMDPASAIDLLTSTGDKLDANLRDNAYSYLANFFGKQLMKNGWRPHTARALADLYQFGLDRGLLFVGGYIRHGAYLNLVRLLLFLNEREKVNQVIETCVSQISPQVVGDYQVMVELECLFYDQKLRKLIQTVNASAFRLPHIEIHARTMQLEALSVDQDDPDWMIRQVRRFAKQLNKSRAANPEWRFITRYIDRIDRLNRLVSADRKGELRQLRADLEAAVPSFPHPWYFAQIEKRMKTAKLD